MLLIGPDPSSVKHVCLSSFVFLASHDSTGHVRTAVELAVYPIPNLKVQLKVAVASKIANWLFL